MKKIAFVLSFILISLFSICDAQTSASGSGAAARSFGYYAAFGDTLKAKAHVTHKDIVTPYVNHIKAEVDKLGGLDEIVVESEEIINDKEAKISLIYVCKNENAKLQKTYILLKTKNYWIIESDKL